MQSFFIQSETELFLYRLEFYDSLHIKKILLDARQQCNEICKHQVIIKHYKNFLETVAYLAKEFNRAVTTNQNMKVPFTAALDFVKERIYPLHSGIVEVPLNQIKTLLGSIFKELLIQGIAQMRTSICSQQITDPRMSYMYLQIKNWFSSHVIVQPCLMLNILEKNLNSESEYFPLCMTNLHHLLRTNHRLSHNHRIQYTLFLKEIGVPFEEVIALFMKEYSVPVCNNTLSKVNNCNHSWDENKNRYIYSIEHLFGKRGSRKNYKAHSCKSLQESTNSSSSDSGCPFAALDDDCAKKVLSPSSMEIQDIEDIKSLVCKKQYSEACQFYLVKKIDKAVMPIRNEHLTGKCASKEIVVDNTGAWLTKLSNSKKLLTDMKLLEVRFSRPSDYFFILKRCNQMVVTCA